jgi:hypothetical protein
MPIPANDEQSHGFAPQDASRGTPLVRGAVSRPQSSSSGDRAGEHLDMRRGRYPAWLYVGVGFILQMLFVSTVVGALLAATVRAAGAAPDVIRSVHLVSFPAGIAVALWTFWNRWRVNEAFSSRFCAGLMNISILYVPIVSWGYANYRAFLKLRGR